MEKKRSSNAFPSRSSPHRNARNVLEPIGRTLAKIAAREEVRGNEIVGVGFVAKCEGRIIAWQE